jgi:putative sigma-54 modulation protein
VQIKISVRHGRLGEDAQRFIREKAEKLLHYFDRLTQIEVTVDLSQKDNKLVEFVVQAEHKHDLVARERAPEWPAAVDLALDKIALQLRRYKEKIQDHRRTPSTGEASGGPEAEEPADE